MVPIHAQRLREAAAALQDRPMRLQQLLRLHGRAGPGALLVVLAVPCLLPVPGAGTLMALVIFLPIPFGNVLPAVALLLIGLGLVFEDGLALLLGAALGLFVVAALVGLVVGGAHWIPQLLATWVPAPQ